jgi:hypothetical protein
MDGGQWGGAVIAQGEIRMIEQPVGVPLSPFDCDLLTAADVVLYDRLLEALVSEALPIGSYAEPLSRESVADDAPRSPRALSFARDGWKVLVLVASRGGQPIGVVDLRQRDAGGEKDRSPTLRSRGPRERVASRLFTANGLAG